MSRETLVGRAFDWREHLLHVYFAPDPTLRFFRGYGPLPGIRKATITSQPTEIVGTKFLVISDDGSTHSEEVIAWEPGKMLLMKMSQFSKPLSRLTTHFDEIWTFDERQDFTLSNPNVSPPS